MDKRQTLINEGIIMEEKLVPYLSKKMATTREFSNLEEAKKTKILSWLSILINDTERHEIILKEISKEYKKWTRPKKN